MSIYVTAKDSAGQFVAHTTFAIVAGDYSNTSPETAGQYNFAPPGDRSYTITASGPGYVSGTVTGTTPKESDVLHVAFTLIPSTSTPTPSPAPPLPSPESGWADQGPVGTSCHLYEAGIGGPFSKYRYTSDLTGESSTQYDGYTDARNAALADPMCNVAPPPPPPTTTELGAEITALESAISGIQSGISKIYSLISDIVSAAEEESAVWRTGFETLWGVTIPDLWTEMNNIVSAAEADATVWRTGFETLWGVTIPDIWTEMNNILSAAEEEAAAWRKGILDLDASLKAWITEGILEILLTKLMEGRKRDDSR